MQGQENIQPHLLTIFCIIFIMNFNPTDVLNATDIVVTALYGYKFTLPHTLFCCTFLILPLTGYSYD